MSQSQHSPLNSEEHCAKLANVLIKELQINEKYDKWGNTIYQKSISAFLEVCQKAFINMTTDISAIENVQVISCSSIFTNVKIVFSSIMINCTKQEEFHKTDVALFLQSLVQIIEMLSQFLKQVTQDLMQLKEFNLFYTNSTLPDSVLHMIHESYSHCHASEKMYGTNFSSFSELLGELFHKTYILQKVFSTIFVKISHPTTDNNLASYYLKVCSLLFGISKLVSDMDHTLLGSTWKVLLSYMSKCKWILIDNIDILPYVQEIARNAEAFSLQCKITTDDQLNELFSGNAELLKSVAVSVRMSAFFLGLCANLLFEYCATPTDDVAMTTAHSLIAIMQNLQSFFVMVPDNSKRSLPAVLRKVLSCHFMKEYDKCLALVANSKPFKKKVLSCDDENSIDPIVQCLICLRLIKSTDERAYSFDFSNTNSDENLIFTLFFHLQEKLHPLLLQSTHCYIDDVVESETPLLARAISNALSSFVVAVSHSKLLHLETLLLNQVLSFNPFNFLLAVDLWCTLFRIISSDQAYRYIQFFITILTHSSFQSFDLSLIHHQLGALLIRTFKLLSLDKQKMLMNDFPLTSDHNFIVWYYLGSDFTKYVPDSDAVLENVSVLLVEKMTTWRKNGCLLSGLPLLISAFRVTANILEGFFKIQNKASSQAYSSLYAEVVQLWKTLPTSFEPAPNMFAVLFSSLAQLTSCLSSTSFNNCDLIHVIQKANGYTQNLSNSIEPGAFDTLLYYFVKLLLSIGQFSLSLELQDEVMLLWRNILSFLVEERDWLIRFKCLEGFEAFSKVTKHPDIVRQICSNESNPQIRDLVRSHLKRDLEPLPANIDIKSIFVPPKKPLIPTKSVYNLAVTKIVHGVKELQSLSPVSLNNDEKTSLKNCVEFLQEILLDR